jgi:hypothetical protein
VKRALLIAVLAAPAFSLAQPPPKPEAQKPPMAAGKAAATPVQKKGATAKGAKKGKSDKAMEPKK